MYTFSIGFLGEITRVETVFEILKTVFLGLRVIWMRNFFVVETLTLNRFGWFCLLTAVEHKRKYHYQERSCFTDVDAVRNLLRIESDWVLLKKRRIYIQKVVTYFQSNINAVSRESRSRIDYYKV